MTRSVAGALSQAETTAGAPPARRRDRLLYVSGLCVALVGVLLIVVLPEDVWSSPAAFTLLMCVVLITNARWMPPGALSWVNIFIAVMFLTNVSYYFAVQLHVIAPLLYMPSTQDAGTDTALRVAALAIVATEAGALSALVALAPPRRACRFGAGPSGWAGSRSVLSTGAVISVVAICLYVYLVARLGGVSLLLAPDYAHFEQELLYVQPPFGDLGMTYLPAGLLLMYVGVDGRGAHVRRQRALVICAFLLYAIVTFWIGDRNKPLLAILAFIYVHHVFVHRIRLRVLVLYAFAAGIPLLFLISYVGTTREGSSSAGGVTGVSGYAAIASAYRPYIGFIDFRSLAGGTLGFAPYASAAGQILPTIFSPRGTPSQGQITVGYVRSTTFITAWLSPTDAAANVGLGGSAIGEAYATFGGLAVLVQFAVIGLVLGAAEVLAAVRHRVPWVVFTALSFTFSLFYLRDDLFGLLRPLVWGVGVAFLVRWVHGASQRARARAASPRRDPVSSISVGDRSQPTQAPHGRPTP